tara:strand:- start:6681 stop:7223 length:543 start_codon:yes stop_codon:yes gene_type:complete
MAHLVHLNNLYRTGIELPINFTHINNNRANILFTLIDREAYDKAMNGEYIRVKLDVVWSDEYHPNCLFDFFYRIYRSFKYNRTRDVQTLYLDYNNTQLNSVFSNNFTERGLTFDSTKNLRHESHTYSMNQLDVGPDGTRTIYVSTWNHIFSQHDNNPDLDKQILNVGRDIPVGQLLIQEN